MADHFKKLHIPTGHLDKCRLPVPAKAHEAGEVQRRKAERAGVLVLRHEQAGLQTMRHQVGQLAVNGTAKDIGFTTRTFAMALANSAHLSHGRGRPVMATPHELLRLLNDDYVELSGEMVLAEFGSLLDGAIATSGDLIDARRFGLPQEQDYRKQVGRQLGKAASYANCVLLADQLSGCSQKQQQKAIRDDCMDMLASARSFDKTIGSAPTVAQLANPLSQLSVYMHDEAPAGAYEALMAAQATFPLAG